jgi:hypothetical protein
MRAGLKTSGGSRGGHRIGSVDWGAVSQFVTPVNEPARMSRIDALKMRLKIGDLTCPESYEGFQNCRPWNADPKADVVTAAAKPRTTLEARDKPNSSDRRSVRGTVVAIGELAAAVSEGRTNAVDSGHLKMSGTGS